MIWSRASRSWAMGSISAWGEIPSVSSRAVKGFESCATVRMNPGVLVGGRAGSSQTTNPEMTVMKRAFSQTARASLRSKLARTLPGVARSDLSFGAVGISRAGPATSIPYRCLHASPTFLNQNDTTSFTASSASCRSHWYQGY